MENYYDQAVEAVQEGRIHARPSSIQFLFRVSYRKACSIIDQMEANGIVTAPDGFGQRHLKVDAQG
jgi:DNA segregation ATPase FtsK/SpoIIIE-like protein